MTITTILCCQLLGTLLAHDDGKVDEAFLKEAIMWEEIRDKEEAQIRAAGGYSPAALPVYKKWLTADPPPDWSVASRTLQFVREADGTDQPSARCRSSCSPTRRRP